MKANVRLMRCGGCGHDKMVVYCPTVRGRNAPETGLFIECQKCHSVTAVRPSQPRLELGYDEDCWGEFEGQLTVFSDEPKGDSE